MHRILSSLILLSVSACAASLTVSQSNILGTTQNAFYPATQITRTSASVPPVTTNTVLTLDREAGSTAQFNSYLRATSSSGFGTMGVGIEAYNDRCRNVNGCTSLGMLAGSNATYTDTLFIVGPTSGYIAIQFEVDGSFTVDPASVYTDTSRVSLSMRNVSIVGTNQVVTFAHQGFGQSTPANDSFTRGLSSTSSANASFTRSGNNLSSFLTSSGVIFLPYLNNQLPLAVDFTSTVSCTATASTFCKATLDYTKTAVLGGAQVYDSQLNLVSNALLRADSGLDYTRPLSGSTVPEPSSAAMLGGLSIAVCLYRYRRNR